MARKIIKIGGWYMVYEVTSTAALLALAAAGFKIPVL